MSLETQVTALVGAANHLTETVASKVGQIDDKVNKAVKAIPELHKTFYVDWNAGNNEALGTLSAPLKTIHEAVNRTPLNGSVAIHLMKNQEHFMSGESAVYTNATNKTITLRAYGTGSKPVIKMGVNDTRLGSYITGFLVSDYSRITAIECVIDTMSFPLDQTRLYGSYGGFVSRGGTVGEVGAALISLSHCEIKLRDHNFSSHYTRVDYNFRTVIIDHVGQRIQLNSGGDTFYCTLNGVSLTDTSKTLKDCLSGATESNTLTNISLVAA